MMSRNVGLDLLRIIAMLMVILLHVLGQGGILKSVPPLSTSVAITKYAIAWIIEIGAYCAVNCYALLTGYNYFGKTPRYAKLFEFWLQIAFYTVGICILYSLLGHTIHGKMWLKVFFPVTSGVYWYVSSYFCLFILIPIINKGLENIEEKSLKTLLCIGFVLVSVLPTFFKLDPYCLKSGYSFAWLLLLFIIGGSLKKMDLLSKISMRLSIKVFVISIIVTWLWKITNDIICFSLSIKPSMANLFVSYTSPTIILSALSLLFIFAKQDINNYRMISVIRLVAPAAFGVYLIHLHPLIWNGIFRGFSAGFVKNSIPVMVFKIFFAALIIYSLCTIVELFRIALFKKIKIYEKINKLISI